MKVSPQESEADRLACLNPRRCRICNGKMAPAFNATILRTHQVVFWWCTRCGWLSSEKPYWLEEAYASPIAELDTDLVARNLAACRKLSILLFCLFGPTGRYVDVAGGTGLLVRLMRDVGFDFRWHDPYCNNVHARGFETTARDGPCNAVTAFEVLEHLEDPLEFVKQTLSSFQSSMLVFSTQLFGLRPPAPEKWSYYAFETGQHIGFFQRRTLGHLGHRLGLEFYSSGGIHILTTRHINSAVMKLATTRLHWLAWPIVRMLMSSRSRTEEDQRLLRERARSTTI